ncbi:MAG: hypothetical protein AABY26_02635, partial [Nanoarchaeota archaeon]
MLLIDDILGLMNFPSHFMKLLERISDDADEQMLKTEESVRKKYMEIQMLYEGGELNEKDYQEWATILQSRLKEIKEYEKQLGKQNIRLVGVRLGNLHWHFPRNSESGTKALHGWITSYCLVKYRDQSMRIEGDISSIVFEIPVAIYNGPQ